MLKVIVIKYNSLSLRMFNLKNRKMENIKVQENYFYRLDNLKEVKVIWKKYDKANVLEIGIEYPTAIVDLDRLLGIPITKEWWYKIDSEIIKGGFSYSHSGLTNSVKIYLDNLEVRCKYVHQIQALFFSIKGRELIFE